MTAYQSMTLFVPAAVGATVLMLVGWAHWHWDAGMVRSLVPRRYVVLAAAPCALALLLWAALTVVAARTVAPHLPMRGDSGPAVLFAVFALMLTVPLYRLCDRIVRAITRAPFVRLHVKYEGWYAGGDSPCFGDGGAHCGSDGGCIGAGGHH